MQRSAISLPDGYKALHGVPLPVFGTAVLFMNRPSSILISSVVAEDAYTVPWKRGSGGSPGRRSSRYHLDSGMAKMLFHHSGTVPQRKERRSSSPENDHSSGFFSVPLRLCGELFT